MHLDLFPFGLDNEQGASRQIVIFSIDTADGRFAILRFKLAFVSPRIRRRRGHNLGVYGVICRTGSARTGTSFDIIDEQNF